MDVWYKELDALNANYKLVSGTGQDRYDNAVKALDGFLNSKVGMPNAK
jgi:hypothetical protein